MVFKPFTHLARQSFAKTITHGYAQSVVAASQSSYASQTTNHLGQPRQYTRTAQLKKGFSASSIPHGVSKSGAAAAHAAHGDAGLAAYVAAWQHAQLTGDESDWRQFEFSRRIGWKPKVEGKDAVEAGKEEVSVEMHHDVADLLFPPRPGVTRAQSANALDEMKVVEGPAAANEGVEAKVDEAVAQEIQQISEAVEASEAALRSAERPLSRSPVSDMSFTPEDLADALHAQTHSQSIVELGEAGKWNEVPAAFEQMLRDGLKPTVGAYNALLLAAIKLPVDAHDAVPKALDVYSDMLRRRVTPNAETYSTLLTFLGNRATEALKMKRALEQQRERYGGMEQSGSFMLQSTEMEHAILAEEDALSIAVKIFHTATMRDGDLAFPLQAYRLLITACAEQGRVDDMIQIFAHMESQKVVPHAAFFAPMISAFAAAGDLNSAVECYNEYKSLAIADDNGVFGIVERRDNDVYAAVVKAYLICGKQEGAQRFVDKLVAATGEASPEQNARLTELKTTIVRDAMVQNALEKGSFHQALQDAEAELHSEARDQTIAQICVAAADAGISDVATRSYGLLSGSADVLAPAMSMLALRVRQGDVTAAKTYWSTISSSRDVSIAFIEPTAMYAIALIKSGRFEEGLLIARDMFSKIRSSATHDPIMKSRSTEEIDEAADLIGRVMVGHSVPIPPTAAVALIWILSENGTLSSPLVEHALASLGPEGIASLNAQDLAMALQAEAAILANGANVFDAAHPARFSHLLDICMTGRVPLNSFTQSLVEQALAKIGDGRTDLKQRWQGAPQTQRKSPYAPARYPTPPDSAGSPVEDTYDPYAYTTDYKGSSAIAEILESSGRQDAHLTEALAKFKNMRRIGRHPRYVTYAKLITAAAKCGRASLCHDILGMARHDVPLAHQYSVVKYGWVSILDAMVAACLNLGDRQLAATFHQEMLSMGAAPSANTFGLYITTLKESTKTFDEATEAVKIFHRAMAEGVEPTSFLYNALIGKLGKARRIDDCLLYFAEMRQKGIRPTSVTYGTVVNALCRVSDERFAEEMFDEMESMPNYKPRPAPYNSMIQYFLNTKRDRSKVLAYYERMKTKNIVPTQHTYKLLVDAYASLEPIDMPAAERVLESMRTAGQQPEAVHYAALVHAKGCVLHDLEGARAVFDKVMSSPNSHRLHQPCLYQALFESMVANHLVSQTPALLKTMASRGVEMTPYIANTLIHGWAAEGNMANAKSVYDGIGMRKREPSTYEAMTRAFLAAGDREGAQRVVGEMLGRGYPSAVAGKIVELVGFGEAATI